MDELTPAQRKKIKKIAAIVADGDLAIAEYLLELEDKFEERVKEIQDAVPNLEQILATIRCKDGVDGNDGESIKGDKGDRGEKGDTVVGPPGRDGRDGRDGIDGRDGESIVGPPGKDGKDGSPDTPEEVRDKLEILKGDERLDKTAIKGLDEWLAEIQKQIPNGVVYVPAGSSGSAITVRDEGVELTTALTSLDFVGSGVTATTSGGAVTVTINNATMTILDITSGDINDSNVDFGFGVEPTEIVIGGVSFRKTGGSTTWTWTPDGIGSLSGVATLSGPVGTGVAIYGRV